MMFCYQKVGNYQSKRTGYEKRPFNTPHSPKKELNNLMSCGPIFPSSFERIPLLALRPLRTSRPLPYDNQSGQKQCHTAQVFLLKPSDKTVLLTAEAYLPETDQSTDRKRTKMSDVCKLVDVQNTICVFEVGST